MTMRYADVSPLSYAQIICRRHLDATRGDLRRIKHTPRLGASSGYQRQVAATVSAIAPQCADSTGAASKGERTSSSSGEHPAQFSKIADPFDSRAALADLASSTAAMGRGFGRRSTRSPRMSRALRTDQRRRVRAEPAHQSLSNITVSGVSGLTSADIPDCHQNTCP